MGNRVTSLLILPVLLSTLAACQPAAPMPMPTDSGQATDVSSPIVTTTTPAVSALESGLAAMASYALHFSIVSEISAGGQTIRSAYQVDVQRVREPFIQSVIVHAAQDDDPVRLVQTREHHYLIPADGLCQYTVAGDSDPVPVEFFRPEELVGEGSSAERVEPDETVNGVLADHYVIRNTDSSDALTRTEGEVWVAAAGNYVVRYVLLTETRDPDTGEAGHIELTYEITDIGVPFDIKEPADCLPTDRQLPGVPNPTG